VVVFVFVFVFVVVFVVVVVGAAVDSVVIFASLHTALCLYILVRHLNDL
jgi:hypothetical protein